MEVKTFSEVDEKYELEIERIVETIKDGGCKQVLLQFPEGMKPYSQVICDEISKKTGCECFIWLGTCFGGCDVPLDVDVDLIVQFGHSAWKF